MSLVVDRDPAPPAAEQRPEQGVIEEARRRQRRRRARRGVGGLVAIAGVGAIAWAIVGAGSQGTTRHARAAGRAQAVHPLAARPRGFGVRLVPVLTGGEVGWCSWFQGLGPGSGGGSCAWTPTPSRPLLGAISSPYYGVTVTTPQVAAILVNGRRVHTVALPGLPYGLRAARIVIPATPRRVIAVPRPGPALVALDASGHPIPQSPPKSAYLVSSRYWQHPAARARGACALRASGVPGLSPQRGHVANAILPYPGRIIGRAFFSCIDAEYYLKRWDLDAAILLDAAHPGTPPAAIPGLRPMASAPGYFNGPGDSHGDLTARRVGGAWLVVAGGSGPGQRIGVLRHLTASIRRNP
jgi:hypothetical protein